MPTTHEFGANASYGDWDYHTGSLAPGVTVQEADFRSISVDAAMKYHGLFLQFEVCQDCQHCLNNFVAAGPVPNPEDVDRRFYVRFAGFPVNTKLELYAATSRIFGDDRAGFDSSHESIGGANHYRFDTRKVRPNIQLATSFLF